MAITGSVFRRNITLQRVLQLIRSRGEISRAELSRITGLKRSSITPLVQELLSLGAIEEKAVGLSSSQGGRKPVLLGLNDSFGYFAGLEPGDELLRVVLLSFSGKPVLREELPLVPPRDFTAFTRRVSSLLQEKYSCFTDRLIGTGIGIPGAVNPDLQVIRESRFFSLKNAPIGRIPCEFPSFLLLDNDSNCCLWGELLNSSAESRQSIVYLLPKLHRNSSHPVEVGIGIAVEGSVYYGSRHLAGEATTDRWYADGPENIGFSRNVLEDSPSFEKAKEEVLLFLLKYLLPFFRVFDPHRIIIGGDFVHDWDIIESVVHGRLKESWFCEGENLGKVQKSKEGAFETAYGAASQCLVKAFKPPEIGQPKGEGGPDLIRSLHRIARVSPRNASDRQ